MSLRPEVGYEFQRQRYLSETEWGRIKKEFVKILFSWGYSSLRRPFLSATSEQCSFDILYFQRFYTPGKENIKVPRFIKTGILMGSVMVQFDYSYQVCIPRTSTPPVRISLKRNDNYEGPLGCDRTLPAIKQVYQEGILKDVFKLVYMCLPETMSFNIFAPGF